MEHEIETGRFVENYRRALGDAQLQRALSAATTRFMMGRGLAIAAMGDEWERLRERARAIKEHSINNLDYYLDQFATNVERAGGRVFWARDAEEANRYVAELARERGASLAVKSKSMVTEEIELNSALERAGVEAVETDLGEYIIQLAGERPSHIIAPAIHKTRFDVADLFAEKLKVERTEEIVEMTAIARRVLRERFARAGLGVTGANFAVAETGSIVLVENEGNIRMTTTLPRAHFALVGIEKVIPRIEDLGVLMKVLPRSASGQHMSAYVSIITGVKQSPSGEGPEELHVVMLDNGRMRMLANEHLREALYCIRCGACLNVCPVYQKIGGHAYGWIYPGPIGSIVTPQLIGNEMAADLPFASSLCGACREACPVKINIPDMLLRLRHEINEGASDAGPARDKAPGSFRKRVKRMAERAVFKVWASAMKGRRRYEKAAGLARLAGEVFGNGAQGVRVPGWSVTRDFPAPARRSFREMWVEIQQPRNRKQHNGD
jgi:L-lactate dehydrogenase complex protein LldF